jgi:hypothetical protein
MKTFSALTLLALVSLPLASLGEEAKITIGGDQYAAGQATTIVDPVKHDAFAAGYDVALEAPVAGDAHLAGFNVNVDADVTGDLYAAGSSINITGTIGGDVTAFGNTVSLRSPVPVAGNVRLAGASVTVDTPVTGAALVTAQTLTFNSSVSGDLDFFGENLSFGPNAAVGGIVTIHATKEIPVSTTVAAADRVKFVQLVGPDYATEAGKTAEHVVRGIWPAVWATGMWWLLLGVIGLLFITLATRLVTALETAMHKRPFRTMGLGILGFAATLGLVPVFALTLVGIFLLPFVLVFVVIACALAYLGGAYLAGIRIAVALFPIDTNLNRVGVLVVSIVLAGLLGMVPVVGWLVTLLLLTFGFGSFGIVTIARWQDKDSARLAAATLAANAPGAA